MSFWGSPGRNSLRLGSPARASIRSAAARRARTDGPASGATKKSATSALSGAARARTVSHREAVASRVREASRPSQTKSVGRSPIVSRRGQGGAEVARREVDPDVRDPGRLDAERAEAPPLVGLQRGQIHLEPADGPTAEAQGPPVVARPEQNDLDDPAADGRRDRRVDDPGPLRQAGGPSERHGEHAGDVAREAALSLHVAGGCRGPRAFEADPLRGDPARAERGSSRPGQGVIALAPAAALRCPKRSDR